MLLSPGPAARVLECDSGTSGSESGSSHARVAQPLPDGAEPLSCGAAEEACEQALGQGLHESSHPDVALFGPSEGILDVLAGNEVGPHPGLVRPLDCGPRPALGVGLIGALDPLQQAH